jgi:hypothetical protein
MADAVKAAVGSGTARRCSYPGGTTALGPIADPYQRT